MLTVGRSHYEVLGIDPGSSEVEIKEAFRRKAIEHHPDHSDEPDAEERFKDVMKAKEALLSSNVGNNQGFGAHKENERWSSETRSGDEYQAQREKEESEKSQTSSIEWSDIIYKCIRKSQLALNKFNTDSQTSKRGSQYELLIGYVLMFFSGTLLTTSNAILAILSVVLLLPTQDYCRQIIRATDSNPDEVPEFNAFRTMLVRGGILLLQAIVYPPAILLSLLVDAIRSSEQVASLLSLENAASAALTVALTIYSLPAIIAALAIDGSLNDETNADPLGKITTGGYAKLFVHSVLSFVGVLTVVALSTPAIGAPLAFYLQTHLCDSIGELLSE